ncbi:MAG: DegT/DnrJ/EryC1/StrS family aminotransferase [Solirubrobacterales bacterium]
MSEQIELARPEVGERERELVGEVLDSGALSLGPMGRRFEEEFAARLGVKDAVAVANGTSALHLAVRAVGWGEGDEVVTTPLSFVASANCLLYERATPVFADIDPVTLQIDAAAAYAAIGERTAGTLPVHLFGYPAPVAELETIAAEGGLGIVEDACQAIGALDDQGNRVGTRGNPTTFAFYPNKQMTTGEGGMLVPSSPQMAKMARSERNQGRSPEMGSLEHDRLGFNYRLPDVAAAIGVAQLEKLDGMLAARAGVAAIYADRLRGLDGAFAGEGDPDGLVLPCADRGRERRSWFVYPVRLPQDADRGAVIESLADAGVQSKAYLPAIHLLPFYRERFGYSGGEFPVAEEVAARSLALPFHTAIGEAEVERVCAALKDAIHSPARS